MTQAVKPTLPEGFQKKNGIAWGSRREGVLEISYFRFKRKNSVTTQGQRQMARLIEGAQNDESVKVILIHGGLFYCAGNELSALTKVNDGEPEELRDAASLGCLQMVQNLQALNRSKKPIVGLIRGQSIGIGFTTTALFDFIYVSPEAKFRTPFMRSCQSPEGGSTMLFAQQFGFRRANEILMLDRAIKAQEAVECGFANGIIEGLNDSHWPDLDKIPCIPKLLATDYRTLVNCKELINAAKDNQRLENTFEREARFLVETWLDEDFPPKLMNFLATFQKKKDKQPQPKL